MKKIEKYLCIILMLLSLLTVLSACRTSHYYDYNELKNNVERIEIIKIYNLDDSRCEDLIITLDSEGIEALALELSKIEFKYPFGDPTAIKGYCFKVYYNNNEYEIIGQMGTRRFDGNGNDIAWYKRECTEKEFNDLVSMFIDIATLSVFQVTI